MRILDGYTFLGWGKVGQFYHAFYRGVDKATHSVCGVRITDHSISKEKQGAGCSKCMVWANKNGVRT